METRWSCLLVIVVLLLESQGSWGAPAFSSPSSTSAYPGAIRHSPAIAATTHGTNGSSIQLPAATLPHVGLPTSRSHFLSGKELQEQFNASGVSSDQSSLRLPLYLRLTATTICVILLVIGCAGNMLVPYVVLQTNDLRNSTNIFLINLSVSDILVLIISTPTVLIELHSQPEVWFLGSFVCK